MATYIHGRRISYNFIISIFDISCAREPLTYYVTIIVGSISTINGLCHMAVQRVCNMARGHGVRTWTENKWWEKGMGKEIFSVSKSAWDRQVEPTGFDQIYSIFMSFAKLQNDKMAFIWSFECMYLYFYVSIRCFTDYWRMFHSFGRYQHHGGSHSCIHVKIRKQLSDAIFFMLRDNPWINERVNHQSN